MNLILVDTSAWVALYNPGDQYHQVAKRFLAEFQSTGKGEWITTDYIVDETLTFLLVRVGFRNASQFGNDVLEKALVNIYPIEREGMQRAWDIFKKFNRDKKWSFTDCTTYVTMKERHLDAVFTFDRKDFSQMGFAVVPSSKNL